VLYPRDFQEKSCVWRGRDIVGSTNLHSQSYLLLNDYNCLLKIFKVMREYGVVF
jgi:hypothetical protein